MAVVCLTIYILCVVAVLGFGLLCAVSDLRGMRIPNVYPALIAGAFVVAYGAALLADQRVLGHWQGHAVAAALMMLVTFCMYLARMLGAGDSKMASAFALWTGLKGLMVFLFYMALAGGLIAVAALVIGRLRPVKNPRPGSWIDRVQNGERVVPYGVAIFAGVCVAFLENGYLAPSSLGAFLNTES